MPQVATQSIRDQLSERLFLRILTQSKSETPLPVGIHRFPAILNECHSPEYFLAECFCQNAISLKCNLQNINLLNIIYPINFMFPTTELKKPSSEFSSLINAIEWCGANSLSEQLKALPSTTAVM